VGKKILVTGGAGFIGSFIVDELVRRGHEVTIYDNLEPQVHPGGRKPEYLNRDARFVLGDVRDCDQLGKAVQGQEIVYHEAAAVGVAQSQDEPRKYVEVNCLGTANLLEAVIKGRHQVERLVIAGSMSSYGEGACRCKSCGPVYPEARSDQRLQQGDYDPVCPLCGGALNPVPTPESKPPQASSVYSTTKRAQEDIAHSLGRTFGIPVVSLRYFNTYGPRQSLNNPYNGVLAIFLSALMKNESPLVYEDGKQARDFVYIDDVVQANMLAMENDGAGGEAFNVGRGVPVSILSVAEDIAKAVGSAARPLVSGRARPVDIRNCFADISRAEKALGYKPAVGLHDGLGRFVEWARAQT
jgi:dTDP-L-rhamnose 4-epimerase